MIKREWRDLPERFHGLGMPNFPVLALAGKTSFLLANWGAKDALGLMMGHCYESFLMEVGLYGSVFSHSHQELGILATESTWFGNFWELAHQHGIRVELSKDWQIQPVRRGDLSLNELAVQSGLRGEDLRRFNVV